MTHSQEALKRAREGHSERNDAIVVGEFMERGIPEEQIQPRVNVFTYGAWRALGRQVRKGEHGVRLPTWVKKEDTQDKEGKVKKGKSYRKTTSVFHISQTDPSGTPKPKAAPKGHQKGTKRAPKPVTPQIGPVRIGPDDKPIEGHQYSLLEISKGKSWADSEVNA